MASFSDDCSSEMKVAADGVGRARMRQSGEQENEPKCPGDAQRRGDARGVEERGRGHRSVAGARALTGGKQRSGELDPGRPGGVALGFWG